MAITTEQQQVIDTLRAECTEFADKVREQINNISNSLDYINGSVFSYNRDRLDMFIDGLNEFKPLN